MSNNDHAQAMAEISDTMRRQTDMLADIRDQLRVMAGVPAELVRVARIIEDHERRIKEIEARHAAR
jgi:hypothetical protein